MAKFKAGDMCMIVNHDIAFQNGMIVTVTGYLPKGAVFHIDDFYEFFLTEDCPTIDRTILESIEGELIEIDVINERELVKIMDGEFSFETDELADMDAPVSYCCPESVEFVLGD